MFVSAFSVWKPPAACQVDPEVSSERSISSRSVHPSLVHQGRPKCTSQGRSQRDKYTRQRSRGLAGRVRPDNELCSHTSGKFKRTGEECHLYPFMGVHSKVSGGQAKTRCEIAEHEKQNMEREYERTNWQLQEAQAELNLLKTTTRHLQDQVSDNEAMLTKVVKAERRRAKEELVAMKHAMVKVVEQERESMRDEFMKQARQLQELVKGVEGTKRRYHHYQTEEDDEGM